MIYIEKDNLVFESNNFKNKNHYDVFHYGNFEAEANLTITNCQFYDSVFSYGLIYIPDHPNLEEYENITSREIFFTI